MVDYLDFALVFLAVVFVVVLAVVAFVACAAEPAELVRVALAAVAIAFVPDPLVESGVASVAIAPACKWASKNHKRISTPRDTSVNKSAVSASPSLSVCSIPARINLA